VVILKTVVVTGAGGHIGSNMCLELIERGYGVIAVDRDWEALQRLPSNLLKYNMDVCSSNIDDVFFRQGKVHACIHMAADISVPRSMQTPLEYYENNTAGSLNVMQSCIRTGVEYFLFSSTAAVYGNGSGNGCSETDALLPINPYGKSKQMVETMLFDAMMCGKLKGCALRYFNVVGNDSQQRVKDLRWKDKTNLFPTVMKSLRGEMGSLTVHGRDYFTEDGTALRDYIHVTDLVKAHILALESNLIGVFNVGTGKGHTVQQVLNEFIRQGYKLEYHDGPRRLGDPPVLFAHSSKLENATGWKPALGLEDMVRDYANMIGVTNEEKQA